METKYTTASFINENQTTAMYERIGHITRGALTNEIRNITQKGETVFVNIRLTTPTDGRYQYVKIVKLNNGYEAGKFADTISSHFTGNILDHIPNDAETIDTIEIISFPQLDVLKIDTISVFGPTIIIKTLDGGNEKLYAYNDETEALTAYKEIQDAITVSASHMRYGIIVKHDNGEFVTHPTGCCYNITYGGKRVIYLGRIIDPSKITLDGKTVKTECFTLKLRDESEAAVTYDDLIGFVE